MTIWISDCRNVQNNVFYRNRCEITDEQSLRNAVWSDYVCATYRDCHRAGENFIEADCCPADIDNTHTEDPSQWIRPGDLAELFPDVRYAIHYSRHHMRDKVDPRTRRVTKARPRFHVLFAIDRCTVRSAYDAIKRRMYQRFTFIDDGAIDAARFFFGTEDPHVEFHDGSTTLNSFLDNLDREDAAAEAFLKNINMAPPPIYEGSRNKTMSHFAGRLLKRLGNTEEARKAYRERAASCDPPLDDDELDSIWHSALKFYRRVSQSEGYISPEVFNRPPTAPGWEDPITFGRSILDPFPVDALPPAIADHVCALAESTQTPVDMAGTCALSVLSTCLQGKYIIEGKSDWHEPLNTYCTVIAPPSERKSAVINACVRPIVDYEADYNARNAALVEGSRMHRRILERKQKAIEEQVAKGKAEASELEKIAEEITGYVELKPLRMFVDDITTEKLVSVIAANDGHMSLISSEAGIFDTLSGAYSRSVNIDVMLKSYSGDSIRVDRIGRESEKIMNPALTVLLMAQPNVIADVLGNSTFRGRGLTARFLYSNPTSIVGNRSFDSEPVPDDVRSNYERCVCNLMEDEYPETPEVITLSEDAREELRAFSDEIEKRLVTDCADIADWCGKLVGTTLRIAGLLCRASVYRDHTFLEMSDPLIVSDTVMQDAIRIGRYYLNHAKSVYATLPENARFTQAKTILDMIVERRLNTFNRRDAMRYCRSFRRAEDIQPVLDFLEDYGYLASITPPSPFGKGRPSLPKYAVNPWVHEHYCPTVRVSSPEAVTN